MAFSAACESDGSDGGGSDGDGTSTGGSDSDPATTSATSAGGTTGTASGGTEGSTVTPGSGGTSVGGTGAGGSSAGGSSAGGTSVGGTGAGGSSAGGSSAGGTGGDMSSGGAAGADGSTTGGTGVVATVGAPCTELGALACVGNRHKVTLVCGEDLAWEVNETCSETEFCDTREGDTAGLCLEAIDACLTRQAGDPFCDGDTLMRCGPDGVTAEVETECAGVCENDACNDDKDQCPQVESEFADCELDCGGADACLPDEGCKYFAPSGFDINGPPTPVRLPAYSGLCDEECSSGRRGLAIQVSSSMGERVRATVGDPWLMVASQEHQLADACDIEEPGTPSCLIFERQAEIGSLYLHLFTEDSDAEPRNVSFELVDETAICP